MNQFLTVTKADLAERGWEEFDFLVITGDAYVDHPSFGPAIISRVLEAEGYKVGILAQPDWQDPESFKALGRPLYSTGPPAAGCSALQRQHRLHGGPLYRGQKAPP